MQIDKSLLKKIGLGVAGAILLNWGLHSPQSIWKIFIVFWGLLTPFVLGLLIAFVINIPMRAIEKLLFKNRWESKLRLPISFLLAFLALLGAVAVVTVVVVPELVKAAALLISTAPAYIRSLQTSLEPYYAYLPQLKTYLQNLNINWEKIVTLTIDTLQWGAGSIFSSAIGVTTSIISGLTLFVLSLVLSVYILMDKNNLLAQLKALLRAYLPEDKYTKITQTTKLVEHTYSQFVSGQCKEAFVLFSIYFTILSIGRFDYALLTAILIGFLSFIPYFGAMFGAIIGGLLMLASSGPWQALALAIIFMIVQQIDSNLIYPRIVGASVGLSPIWVMISVIVGGSLMGIFGILVFIPLFSILYSLLRKDAHSRLVEKGLAIEEVPAAETNAEKKPSVFSKFKNKNK